MDNLTVKKVICSYLLENRDKVCENNFLHNTKGLFSNYFSIKHKNEMLTQIYASLALEPKLVFTQT